MRWLARAVDRQLRRPSGLVGRLVTAPWLNRTNAAMNGLVLRLLDLRPADRILEVGFGGGELLGQIARWTPRGLAAGVDHSAAMVARAERAMAPLARAGRVQLHLAGSAALPFAGGSFDKACAVNVVYFWPDPAGSLAELRRVLVPGGLLLLGFRSKAAMERYEASRSQCLRTDAEMAAMAERAGFSVRGLHRGQDRHGDFACLAAISRSGEAAPR
ncbi:MAG TPA: methyltransferase domain-containing protein [Candidatus Polarisedimenticolia bacterium]|nr:methyltransferase domain-containing protein [Candidatus Polarisedimenticolia bacterium]